MLIPPNRMRVPYAHTLFVDREEEVDLIVDQARRMVTELDRNRVIIFNAPRGVGKSWLLQEIDWRFRQESHPAIVSYYLDLDRFLGPSTEAAVSTILSEVLGRLGLNNNMAGLSVFDLSTLLSDSVQASKKILVLLVDHVDESDNSLLESLEDRCLAPLTTSPNVLLILAGRGREYTWKKPHLRPRSHSSIPPFDDARTRLQLNAQLPAAASKATHIFQLSGGYPLANYLYGLPNPPDVVNVLLDRWAECRDDLEALCVLRAFDESRIPTMFECRFGHVPDLPKDYAASRRVRERLVATSLVRWDAARRGYIIDEAICPILENSLLARDKPLWCRLHSAAHNLYAGWSSQFSKSSADWAAEAAYHLNKLKEAGFKPGQCAKSSTRSRRKTR